MITERSGNFLHFKIHFIRKWKKLRKIYKFILAMSPQQVNQNGGEGGGGGKEGKAIDRIRKRMIEEVQKKIKCCIRNDKLGKKQYIKKYESNSLKYNKKNQITNV